MRQAWLTCATLSIAAHALAVTLWPASDQTYRQASKESRRNVVWQARLARATPPALPQPLPEPTGLAQQHAAPAAAPLPEAVADNAPQPQPETSPPLTPIETPAPSANPDPGPTPANPSGDSEYIPRPQLSVPPVPESPVLVAPPPGLYPPERIRGILSLFIDENGKVNHILVSGDPMPPEFEALAKQAFMATPFHPGQQDGHVVKSRIRVEVVFDNTPLNPPVAHR